MQRIVPKATGKITSSFEKFSTDCRNDTFTLSAYTAFYAF